MKKFINREILSQLETHLLQPEITVLVGARRTGKTTLLSILQKTVEKENNQTLYYNLDKEEDYQTFTSQKKVINLLEYHSKKLLQSSKKKLFVFIDEIQQRENAGRFIKGIYDHLQIKNLPIKLIITGSGSIDIKAKIHESLAGRKRIFTLYSLSFSEFLRFKNSLSSAEKIEEFAQIYSDVVFDNLIEYINYGGYPQVVLEEDKEQKQHLLNDIFSSYIKKDIRQILPVEKPQAFVNLFKLITGQIGGLVNIADFSRTLGISQQTINTYLDFMEKTYMIKIIKPYYKNPKREITHSPVIYLNDLGIYSYITQSFNFNLLTEKQSFVFENFIYRQLLDNLKIVEEIRFWRTNTGAEVDFVIGTYNQPIPVEVKMKNFQGKPSYGKSYYSFLNKYNPTKAYLYNLDTLKHIKIKNTSVSIIPYYLPPN